MPATVLRMMSTSPDKSLSNRQTLFSSLAVGFLGLLLSAALYTLLLEKERKIHRQALTQAVLVRADIIQADLNAVVEVLHSMVAFYRSSTQVSHQEFTDFVASALSRHPAIEAMMWIEGMAPGAHNVLEAEARQDGYPAYRLQLDSTVRTEQNRLFPVRQVHPLAGHEHYLGMELSRQGQLAEVLEQAASSASVAVSTPVQQFDLPAQQDGSAGETEQAGHVLLFLPLFEHDSASGIESVRGFAAVSLDPAMLVEGSLLRHLPEAGGLDLTLFEQQADGEQGLLWFHSSRSRTDSSGGQPLSRVVDSYRQAQGTIRVGDREWQLVASALPGSAQWRSSWLPMAGLLLGLVLSGLLASFVYGMASRRQYAEKKVVEATRELASSEARIRSILENVVDGVITIDQHGLIQSFNPAAVKIFGYQVDEVMGRNVNMLMPEPYHSAHDGYLANYMRGGEAHIIGTGREVQGRHKNGSVFPLDLAVGEMDLDGQRVFTGVVRDITERKLAEKEISGFKTTLDSTLDCVFIFDPDSLKFSYVNLGASKQVGYSFAELLTMTPVDIRPDISETEFRKMIAPLLAGDVPALHFEAVHGHCDGRHIPVEIGLQYVCPEGEAGRFVAIVRDISERLQAKKKLEATSELQRAILNSADYTIISTDTDGVIQTFNACAEKSLGYSAEEMVGINTPAVFHDPDEVVARARRLSEELGREIAPGFEVFVAHARLGKVDENEWTYVRKDGSRFPVMLSITSLRDTQGDITGFLGIGSDITERKEVDRMKNEFISTVSHELRTPLTSIRGSLGLLLGGAAGELPEQARALLDIANNNSERLVRLINDILDIEKIESGKMHFDMQTVDVRALVAEAVEANRGFAQQYGVTYRISSDGGAVRALLDHDRITQVVTNLLSNAAKFSPQGANVEVGIHSSERKVRVQVSDHGAGVPEAFQAKVFEKFSQADASDTRQKGGTGLGLSICKAIVEKHGGRIGFESVSGKGATFFFELPQLVVRDDPQPESMDGTSRRVLVCEDDNDVAQLIGMMLEQSGFATDKAYTAEQAKRMLAEHTYVAMTLDLMLPGQDGIALLRELREDLSTRDLPIVVISARAAEGRAEIKGSALEVVDWMDKPIDQQRLLDGVKKALSRGVERPRVLHVEDDVDVARVVEVMLENQADVVSVTHLQQARECLQNEMFDLVLLDINLPDGSGLELLPVIDSLAPPVPVLVFSAYEVENGLTDKINAALVKSSTSNQQLLTTIESLIGGLGQLAPPSEH